jgi:hypothetical protein
MNGYSRACRGTEGGRDRGRVFRNSFFEASPLSTRKNHQASKNEFLNTRPLTDEPEWLNFISRGDDVCYNQRPGTAKMHF